MFLSLANFHTYKTEIIYDFYANLKEMQTFKIKMAHVLGVLKGILLSTKEAQHMLMHTTYIYI